MPNPHDPRLGWLIVCHGLPLGDFHAVDELDRADLGIAQEGGSDTARLVALEANCNSIVHPVDMILDRLDERPHGSGCRIYFNGNRNICHELTSEIRPGGERDEAGLLPTRAAQY